jgi:DnaJ-class molecular chaperone
MVQPAVWYDTCQVCLGRGTVPCNVCSGVGHIRDTEHGLVGIQPRHGEARGQARQRTTAAIHRDCPDCGGTGVESCTACHGHGMKGQPAFAGSIY